MTAKEAFKCDEVQKTARDDFLLSTDGTDLMLPHGDGIWKAFRIVSAEIQFTQF